MAKASLLSRIKMNARNRDSNANATLGLMIEAIAHFEDQGDWTNLAWILALSKGADRKRLSDILAAATGITFKADKKQPTGLRINDKGSETNLLGALHSYYAGGYSFRSKELEEYEGRECSIPALLVAKEPKLRTVEEVMLAAVRKAIRDNGEQATKTRLIAALGAAIEAELS